MNTKDPGQEGTEEKLVLKDLKSNPYHRLSNAFSLMAIIPLLTFFYILVVQLFSISILIGSVGLLASLAVLVALTGYLLSHDILSGLMRYAINLRRVDKSRAKFIAKVAHELKNPIFTIMGNIENMIRGVHGTLSNKQKEILNLCQDVTGRMDALTSNLSDLHKIEAGVVDITRKLLDLLDLLGQQEKELEVRMEQKRIRFKKEIMGEDFSFWADENKITQVINNLLANAIKYTPENGDITITVSKRRESIKLVVHNTGPHIPKDELESIFNKYKRLDTSQQGLGLGLAIAKEIIDLHKGSIWAESDPETGNRFIVVLPRDLRQAPRPKENLPKREAGKL